MATEFLHSPSCFITEDALEMVACGHPEDAAHSAGPRCSMYDMMGLVCVVNMRDTNIKGLILGTSECVIYEGA